MQIMVTFLFFKLIELKQCLEIKNQISLNRFCESPEQIFLKLSSSLKIFKLKTFQAMNIIKKGC